MVTLRELIDRFTTWLAKLDETRGKWDNPLAKLTGREFYALAGAATLALVLILAVAWRSGVNAGQGALPYKAVSASTNTGGTSAYAPAVQNDISAAQSTESANTTAQAPAPPQPAAVQAPQAQSAPVQAPAAGSAAQANAGTASQGTSEQAKP